MTFLIRCITHVDYGIMSVPMIAKDYEDAANVFYRYFGKMGYEIVDISIIDYEEF